MITEQKPVTKDRLTYRLMWYHIPPDSDAQTVECGHTRTLEHRDQPYIRKMVATEAWQPLDYGWIKEPSTILIETFRLHLPVNPSEEQKKAYEEGILELGYADSSGGFLVYPGQSLPFNITKPESLQIRSLKGDVHFCLHAYSK